MAVPRLGERTLAALPPEIVRPAYNRRAISCGIVHLGIGAFHRAHQAVYTDDRVAAGESGWGIAGLSLRSPDVHDALAPQDALYTVLQRGPDGDRARVIGSVLDVITVPNDPDRAMRRLTDPAVRVVSLTVTEKAYCQDAATSTLDENHPGIVADLAAKAFPRTVPGLLAEALRRRCEEGVGGITVLVCDNLPSNGDTVARIVGRYAELRDPALAGYIANEAAFPCTMVDRIVPATTDTDRAAVTRLGYEDAWPVVAEPFSQWVIEDRFVRGRPRWEEAGAEIVRDVRPYELMKLRALNGAHSSLAYLGALAGLETVADATADPTLSAFLRALWDEDLLPGIPAVPGMDLPGYTAELTTRFRNTAIRHRLRQIAMDGSQKLPQRLLSPALDRLGQGAMPRRIATVVAAWMRFLQGRDEQGRVYEVNDPLASRLTALASEAGDDAEALAGALFGVSEVFAPDLVAHDGFRTEVIRALGSLLQRGVRAMLGTLSEHAP
ncbi:MAG: mannitol dehydrogenase family protein [Acetobacteraceae bacterium]|nr:mannitol dehydrogenase family protein [Acetobacteraceae bacterium]